MELKRKISIILISWIGYAGLLYTCWTVWRITESTFFNKHYLESRNIKYDCLPIGTQFVNNTSLTVSLIAFSTLILIGCFLLFRKSKLEDISLYVFAGLVLILFVVCFNVIGIYLLYCALNGITVF